MSDIECPYCEFEQEVYHDEAENTAEGEIHQMECYECEKNFVFSTCVYFDYTAAKADCLNEGGEHNWTMTNIAPRQYTKMRCKDCDARRKPTVDEMQEIMVGDKL